jgi:hypothetical protein
MKANNFLFLADESGKRAGWHLLIAYPGQTGRNGHKGTKTQRGIVYYILTSCLCVLVAKIFC